MSQRPAVTAGPLTEDGRKVDEVTVGRKFVTAGSALYWTLWVLLSSSHYQHADLTGPCHSERLLRTASVGLEGGLSYAGSQCVWIGSSWIGRLHSLKVCDAAVMQSLLGLERRKSGPCPPCHWSVDLKLTHLDWNPEATLIHFQGQYLTICELDYAILQREIQNTPKTKAAVDIGDFCLVEDLTSACWYRGRIQNRKEDLLDVFLIDHGNILSVDVANISSCSNDLFSLPPKVVCGFLANVLLLQHCPNSVVEKYLSNLIGRHVTGYIQALLPHKILLLETPDINIDLVREGFGRHVDTNTFLLLVEMLTEVPLKQSIEPVPDLLIKKPREQDCCFKLPGLQGYDDILTCFGPRFSRGTRAKVCVTAAVHFGLFYCRMASMETDLWEMSEKLGAVLEYGSDQRNRNTPENLGLLCAVKGKDGKWYRGFVQILPVNSHVRVFFIDYGFFETVSIENVHRLPPEFDSTPIMAFPCALFSLSDQDEAARGQQLSFLKAGLFGRVLNVEIRGFDEDQHLYSVTVIGTEDNHAKGVEECPKIKVQSGFETEELSSQGGYLYHETLMCETLGKTLEAEEVQAGSVIVGYVEHVQNPHQFWIRTQKRNDDFEEMMTKMDSHFRRVKLDEDVLLNPELGALCCAVYEKDMHFYRGVVTDILEHGAEVLFIDFGNVEKVPHKLIKKIPKEFATKSAFAFCCSLANVVPLDEVWTSSSCDFFSRAVSNKALLVHVVQVRRNKFVVHLFEMGSDGNRSVTKLMISSKQAEYWNNIPIEPVAHSNTDVTETARCPGYSESLDISRKTEQLDDLEKNVKSCRSETETAKTSPCFRALNIKPGFDFAVCCSYIHSPSDFWCQPLDKTAALKELMDKVQLYYSTHTVALQSGESCCVAKSPQDGRWCRAFITEKQEAHVKVMLVDYGCTFQIKEHSLQGMMSEYVHLEAQAFRCSLYNLIEPAEPEDCGNWSPDACNILKDFVHKSTSDLGCRIVSTLDMKNKGLCNVVDLYDTRTKRRITDLLLEHRLARKVNVLTKQLSAGFPHSFVFSSYDLSPGNVEEVFVTHVSSQWELYCQLDRNVDIIEELEKKISEESEKMMQASTRAVVRKLCLAKYFDGKWYRGLVHPVQSALHLSVFFVDYGNANISEKTHVMFIPRDSAYLLYTPMQAFRCSLASVSKEELYADVKEYLDRAILNKQVRVLVVGQSKDGSFDVEMFDGDVNINEKVKELIASHLPKPKTVVRLDLGSTRTRWTTPHRRKTKTQVKRKRQHGRQASNSATPNAHWKSNVGCASCKNSKSKHSFYGKAQTKNENKKKGAVPVKPQKISQVKRRESFDTSRDSQYSEKTEIPQLSCLPDIKVSEGFRAVCFVSHINSVNCFFLQLSEDEGAILKMLEDLNSGVFKESSKTVASLRVNDLVVAEYEEDGALYRSAVIDEEGSSCFKVEFVDYGNTATMGKDRMYAIPEKYLSQPRFSIPCFLSDTSTYKSDASFTDSVIEKPLMVDFVRQCGARWEVEVEVLDGAAGPPAPLEIAVESNTKTEKEETASAASFELEDSVTSHKQNNLRQEMREIETTESESVTSAVDGEKSTLKPQLATLLPKLEVIIRRCLQRTPTRKTKAFRKPQKKNNKFSLKLRSVCEDPIIPPDIRSRDMEICTVLSVLSDGTFYVRLKRTSDWLSSLESVISDNLQRCEMVAEEEVKQHLKCLVQAHQDGKWHRAVVQHVFQEKCQVLLLDHGLTQEISTCSIRQQCSYLTKIPNFAVLCKMNHLSFSEGDDAHKSWCETIQPMIGKKVKLMFVCHSEADELWSVEIIMNGLFFIDQTSLLQNKGIMPSQSGPRSENAEEQSSAATSKPQQLFFSPVEIDKAYSGFVAAMTTPFEFSVVLGDSLLVMNEVSLISDDLSEQMPAVPEAHLIPGTCCLLKLDTTKKWCRAEIVRSDATVILNLVDSGHYEYVQYEHCSKLKRLPVDLMNLPKLTYPCVLRGVKPVRADGRWTEEAALHFQQCLYQKKLQIFFREFVSNTHWKVDVLVDEVHVAKELVDAGHASCVDDMLGLRSQEGSQSKAAAQRPGSEEECGQEDEVCDMISDLSVKSTDEAEGKTPRGVVSGSSHCFLM